MKTIKRLSVTAGLVFAAGPASAQLVDSGDTAWILTSTALVLFMTLPGLALFYAGLVRARSVLSVLMQCFAICCVVSLVWIAIGYSMSFGESAVPGFVGGLGAAFLNGVT
ncbi:MAG: ammonia channel protein, partial [Gammaproteobacteria bacterium]